MFMLAVSMGAAVIRVLSRVTIFTGGRNVEYELRAVLLARLHKLGPSFFRKMPTGDIMSRATNDLGQVRLLLGFGVLNVMSALFSLTSALYVMLTLSVSLTVAALTTFPVMLLLTRSFSGRLFRRNRENQEAIGRMSERVLASLAGVRVVRSFALEEAEATAFEAHNRSYLEKNLALARLRGSMGPIMGWVTSVGVLVIFWYGARLVLDGAMSKGAFVSFWLALLRLMWPIVALGFVISIIQRGRASYARLSAIYDAVPEVESGALPKPELVRGDVRVDGLRFKYGDREVLSGVTFHVSAGSRWQSLVARAPARPPSPSCLRACCRPPEGRCFSMARTFAIFRSKPSVLPSVMPSKTHFDFRPPSHVTSDIPWKIQNLPRERALLTPPPRRPRLRMSCALAGGVRHRGRRARRPAFGRAASACCPRPGPCA